MNPYSFETFTALSLLSNDRLAVGHDKGITIIDLEDNFKVLRSVSTDELGAQTSKWGFVTLLPINDGE